MNESSCSCKKHTHVIIFSAILLVFLGVGGYFFYKYRNSQIITVIGSAQSQVTNQIATFTLSIDIQNKDKQAAVDEATTKVNQIIADVTKFGIPDKDIITQNMNVYQNQDPYYENGTTVYKPGDWHANYSISITLRDLIKSDALTALLVGIEKTTMYGPNLTVDPTQVDEGSILAKAVIDARTKALKIAAQSGKKLGGIVSITEGSVYNGSLLYGATGMGAGGGGIPVQPGSTTVTKTVTVTFRLR
jgi:uncharacterized protein